MYSIRMRGGPRERPEGDWERDIPTLDEAARSWDLACDRMTDFCEIMLADDTNGAIVKTSLHMGLPGKDRVEPRR